jgi:hypothetical protein
MVHNRRILNYSEVSSLSVTGVMTGNIAEQLNKATDFRFSFNVFTSRVTKCGRLSGRDLFWSCYGGKMKEDVKPGRIPRTVPGSRNLHTYIHTYIHTCIHTYIHTYIRTHVHM